MRTTQKELAALLTQYAAAIGYEIREDGLPWRDVTDRDPYTDRADANRVGYTLHLERWSPGDGVRYRLVEASMFLYPEGDPRRELGPTPSGESCPLGSRYRSAGEMADALRFGLATVAAMKAAER